MKKQSIFILLFLSSFGILKATIGEFNEAALVLTNKKRTLIFKATSEEFKKKINYFCNCLKLYPSLDFSKYEKGSEFVAAFNDKHETVFFTFENNIDLWTLFKLFEKGNYNQMQIISLK